LAFTFFLFLSNSIKAGVLIKLHQEDKKGKKEEEEVTIRGKKGDE